MSEAHDPLGPIPMTSASARRLADACSVALRSDDPAAAYDALAKAVAGLWNCAATLERLEAVERSLDHERERRLAAEAETRAVKAGALDHLELDRGLDRGALIEAVRLVRYHLTSAGADHRAPTVGMAKWAADRLALGRGPRPETPDGPVSFAMSLRVIHDLARGLSDAGRRLLAHDLAALAHRLAGLG